MEELPDSEVMDQLIWRVAVTTSVPPEGSGTSYSSLTRVQPAVQESSSRVSCGKRSITSTSVIISVPWFSMSMV